jgi:hypothetical protein
MKTLLILSIILLSGCSKNHSDSAYDETVQTAQNTPLHIYTPNQCQEFQVIYPGQFTIKSVYTSDLLVENQFTCLMPWGNYFWVTFDHPMDFSEYPFLVHNENSFIILSQDAPKLTLIFYKSHPG